MRKIHGVHNENKPIPDKQPLPRTPSVLEKLSSFFPYISKFDGSPFWNKFPRPKNSNLQTLSPRPPFYDNP